MVLPLNMAQVQVLPVWAHDPKFKFKAKASKCSMQSSNTKTIVSFEHPKNFQEINKLVINAIAPKHKCKVVVD
jgi:hypothetical protein